MRRHGQKKVGNVGEQADENKQNKHYKQPVEEREIRIKELIDADEKNELERHIDS